MIELLYCKPVRSGKKILGETIGKGILPHMDYLYDDMTLMDVKRYIYEKFEHIFKNKSEGDMEEYLNKHILV